MVETAAGVGTAVAAAAVDAAATARALGESAALLRRLSSLTVGSTPVAEAADGVEAPNIDSAVSRFGGVAPDARLASVVAGVGACACDCDCIVCCSGPSDDAVVVISVTDASAAAAA